MRRSKTAAPGIPIQLIIGLVPSLAVLINCSACYLTYYSGWIGPGALDFTWSDSDNIIPIYMIKSISLGQIYEEMNKCLSPTYLVTGGRGDINTKIGGSYK